MNRDEIITKVMVCLDEMIPEGEGGDFLTNEPLPIHDYVDSFLDDAAKDVLRIAPTYLCYKTSSELDVKDNNGTKHISVPSNFLRMISIECEDWEHPVIELIDPKTEPNLYIFAKNTYNVGKAKPKAAITTKKTPGDGIPPTTVIIELFNTSKEKATITYIPVVTAQTCGDKLIPAIAWLTATKILITSGKEQAKLSQAAYENEIKLLYVKN